MVLLVAVIELNTLVDVLLGAVISRAVYITKYIH